MRKFSKIGLLAFLALGVVSCSNSDKKTTTTESQPVSNKVNMAGVEMTPEEYVQIQFSVDSLMKAPGRVVLSPELDKIFMIPDSIMSNPAIVGAPDFDISKYWTPEQKRLSRIISDIQLNNVKLVDGKIIVDISRADFVKKGLPEGYYDFFVQSYNDVNFFNKIYKKTPEQIASDWAEMQADYRKRLNDGTK